MGTRVAAMLAAKGSSVVTVHPSATVAQVVAELVRHGVGALVVSADGVRIDGIVSERDVVRRMASYQGDLGAEPVTSIMSGTVETCSPDDPVEALMATMTERRFRHLPVVDADGALAGIVSIGDVVKSRIDDLERDRRELHEYITAR